MTDTQSKPTYVVPAAAELLATTKQRLREMTYEGMREAAQEGRTYIALGRCTLEEDLRQELVDKGYLVEDNPCSKHGPTQVVSWDGPALHKIMQQVEDSPLRSLMTGMEDATMQAPEVKPS